MVELIKRLVCSKENDKTDELIRIVSSSNVNIPKNDCFNGDRIVSLLLELIQSDNWRGTSNNGYINTLIKTLIYSKGKKRARVRVCDLASTENSKAKNADNNPRSLYEFGVNVYRRERDTKGWDLLGCIKHIRKRINGKEPLSLSKYEWNNRLHWDNTDGSHHLAVLIYWLNHLGRENFWMPAMIETYNIDENVAKRLEEYSLYILSTREAYCLKDFLGKDEVEIVELRHQNAMVAFQVENKKIDKKYINILDLASEEKVVNFNKLLSEKGVIQ